VVDDFDFQIIDRETRKPINVCVSPKQNNTYRIKFQPKSVRNYLLRALPKSITPADVQKKLDEDEEFRNFQQLCCDQTAAKSKLKQNFLNPIIDNIPTELLQSYSDNKNDDIKINVSSTSFFFLD
jgi:hypothetical protein